MIKDCYRDNTKHFFEKVNKIKKGFKVRSTIMRREDGSLITENTDVATEFKNVFDRMLNQLTRNEVEEIRTTVK